MGYKLDCLGLGGFSFREVVDIRGGVLFSFFFVLEFFGICKEKLNVVCDFFFRLSEYI